MAWLFFHSSAAGFKAHKKGRIVQGTETVLQIQRFRSPAFDRYFHIFSFFAEEEFYLIVLPLLFWNFDATLARRLNFLVCSGLLFGNLYKDAFELPRPSSPPVWCPSSVKSMDSTACRDFGFPSTHAMNAVSNAVFVVLYLYAGGRGVVCEFPLLSSLLLMGLWIVSISLGRLYLGVHTPTDVRGGFVIGLVFAFVWHLIASPLDSWLIEGTGGLFGGYLLAAALLSLHPQPRPTTPTFLQNCLLMGLLLGAFHGSRLRLQDLAAHPELQEPAVALASPVAALLRTLLGYAFVIVVRQLAKTVTTLAFRAVGIDCKQGAAPNPRDWDLLGLAVSKVVTYHALAFSITFLVPTLLQRLQLIPRLEYVF